MYIYIHIILFIFSSSTYFMAVVLQAGERWFHWKVDGWKLSLLNVYKYTFKREKDSREIQIYNCHFNSILLDSQSKSQSCP